MFLFLTVHKKIAQNTIVRFYLYIKINQSKRLVLHIAGSNLSYLEEFRAGLLLFYFVGDLISSRK